MRPILFLLNDRWFLKSNGTNATLIRACQELGYAVYQTDIVHLQATSASELYAEAIEVPPIDRLTTRDELDSRIARARTCRVELSAMEAIFIRTTPGKDIVRAWAHRLSIEVLRLASEMGIRVINDPVGLQKASSKLYTVCLPQEFVPRTMVCHSIKSVQMFAERLGGPLVIKPLLGSQGRDVFYFDSAESVNTRQVVDILGRTGYLVVQEFLPEATEGDIRVLTLDDKLVGATADKAIGIRRKPGAGEFRSNISLGGTPEVVQLTDRQTEVCQQIAAFLLRDGIRFAGIDLIGDRIVEVNVFSPSGLQELITDENQDIARNVVAALLRDGEEAA